MKKVLIIFTLLIVYLPFSNAQDIGAVWLHGYNDDLTFWQRYTTHFNNTRRLLNWRIKYEQEGFQNITNEVSPFINSTSNTNGSVFVIGHSMGGLISRRYSSFNSNSVRGIITVATSNQGAPITENVINGNFSATTDNAILIMLDGPSRDLGGLFFATGVQGIFGQLGNAVDPLPGIEKNFWFALGSVASTVYGLGAMLNPIANQSASGFATAFVLAQYMAVLRDFEDANIANQSFLDMRPNGPAMNAINSTPANVPTVTILAEENDLTPFRIASSSIQRPQNRPFESVDDTDMIDLRNAVKNIYSTARVTNDALKWLNPLLYNQYHDRARAWRRGQDYIEDQFEADYNRLIGATRTESVSGSYNTMTCEDGFNEWESLEEIPPSVTTGNCVFETVHWAGNRTINEPSDGLVPLSMQTINGLSQNNVLLAQGVNHLEVANHPEITRRFNNIWNRSDAFGVPTR